MAAAVPARQRIVDEVQIDAEDAGGEREQLPTRLQSILEEAGVDVEIQDRIARSRCEQTLSGASRTSPSRSLHPN